VLPGDLVQNFDYVVASLFVDGPGVSALRTPGTIGRRLPAPELARQKAGRQRAPDQDAEALVERERYELVLQLSRDEGVVDLLADEAFESPAL
jgi:hypothetical protein